MMETSIVPTETAARDSTHMVESHVNQLFVAYEDPTGRFPVTSIGLANLTFSCHTEIDEEIVNTLVSMISQKIKDRVMDAYHGHQKGSPIDSN